MEHLLGNGGRDGVGAAAALLRQNASFLTLYCLDLFLIRGISFTALERMQTFLSFFFSFLL